MIKKIANLTYNELTKQFKKVSILVMIGVILLVAILLPIGSKMLGASTEKGQLYTGMQINGEGPSDTEDGKRINKELADSQKDAKQLAEDGKVMYNEWRINLIQEYENNLMDIIPLKEVIKGTNVKIISSNTHGLTPMELQELSALPKEEVNKKLVSLEKRNAELKDIIKNNDYLKHLSIEIPKQEQMIQESKKMLVEEEAQLKKDPANKEIEERVHRSREDVSRLEKILNIDKYRFDNKINYDKNNWKNNTLESIEEDTRDLSYGVKTEAEFNKENAMMGGKKTYQEYQTDYVLNKQKLEQKMERNWYSLNHNIPQIGYVKDARTMVNKGYHIFIMLAVVMVIIVGGSIVATEFSSGTIRLLLIRPVSRSKILFSKLATVFIIGYGILLIGTILLTITSGAVYGFDGLTTPVLERMNESVVEVPYFQYMLSNLLVASTSLLFMIVLVFTLTTLTKNTALAVGVSMLVYLAVSPLTPILGGMNMPWIDSTFLPYINQSLFALVPALAGTSLFTLELNPVFGSIQLLVVSAVLLVVTFVVFAKKDVKN